jgi:nucleotide-binding universal stress UspA family protein
LEPQTLVDELTGGLGEVVVEPGVPDQVLLRIAERVSANLIVVGHRGIGGSQRFLGSTSEAVLAATRVPVIVVP